MFLDFLNAFWVGGLICVAGQLLLSLTSLTPARILVLFVTLGVFLGAIGVYQPLANFAGAGASVPLTGFGNSLAQGAIKGVKEMGLLGAFTGGVSSTAAGITAAIVFGYLAAVIFKPKMRK